MKLTVLLLAAMLPLSACIVEPDRERVVVHEYDPAHCDHAYTDRCEHYH